MRKQWLLIVFILFLLVGIIVLSPVLFKKNMVIASSQTKNEVKKSTSPLDIYSNTKAGMLSDIARRALPRVYVPNGLDNTVTVINPETYQVIETFPTGKKPQHVVPSYDLRTLWVANNKGNSLTPIDPNTGKPGKQIHVDNPYNLYFTPDGKFAIVVCEGRKRLEFRDPQTMALHDFVPVQCKGANHMEFTNDGRYAIVTCEFSGQLFKLDIPNRKILGYLSLPSDMGHHSMPQDIRSSPDGSLFFVADMMMNGVFVIDPTLLRLVGFIPTGIGTHSLYPSRDGKLFYVGNRGCNARRCNKGGPGNITVIDPFTQKIVAFWSIPGGGSPDMGNVSANGKELWLSGRYDSEVYVFDTTTGQLTHRIPVGRGPHGLAIWPQPGRYSLGHTGNMR